MANNQDPALILYVRRHSILALGLSQGGVEALSIRPNEPLVHLYFYENTNSGSIEYGLQYREHYEARRPQYLGDIIEQLWDEDNTYRIETKDNRRAMKYILHDAHVYADIREAWLRAMPSYPPNAKIKTYLIFDVGIEAVHRQCFMEQLREVEYFDLLYYGASLPSVVVASTLRECTLTQCSDEYSLVVDALTEDLRLCLVQHSQLAKTMADTTLRLRGGDLRREVLLRRVVEGVNRLSNFLKTTEEIELEVARLGHLYGDLWMARLHEAATTPHIPIKFENISFACAPQNIYSQTIKYAEVEEATKRSLQTVLDEVVKFATKQVPESGRIVGVQLLGDACRNSYYSGRIEAGLNLSPSAISVCSERDIASKLRAYDDLDSADLLENQRLLEDEAEKELSQLREAKENRLRQAESLAQQMSEGEKRRQEREFREAYDRACDLMKQRNFVEAKNFFHIALERRPEEKSVQSKLQEIELIAAGETLKEKQYANFIDVAQRVEMEGDLDAALDNYRSARSVASNPDFADQNIERLKDILKIRKDSEACRDRARGFIEVKAYAEASIEIEKGLLISRKGMEVHTELLSLQAKLSVLVAEADRNARQLSDLRDCYYSDKSKGLLIEATNSLRRLIELDEGNSVHWLAERTALEQEIETMTKRQQELVRLVERADEALFEERYDDAIRSAELALELGGDEGKIKSIMLKAQDRRAKVEVNTRVSEVKEMLKERNYTEAKMLIDNIVKEYPSCKDVVKSLRQLLFDAEEKEQGKRSVETSSAGAKKSSQNDDFFSSAGRSHQPQPKRPTRETKSLSDDDFFNN